MKLPHFVAIGLMLTLRSLSLVFLLVCFFATSARAVDPRTRISQYAHTAWRVRDGFFNGSPNAIGQTRDGYLWIGTQVGLARFDGVQFTPWVPPDGKSLPSSQIVSLWGARDGSLWIGTGLGLAQWKNGDLINFPETSGRINSIFEDSKGVIWTSRTRNREGGVCRVAEAKALCYGPKEGGPSAAEALVGDREGNLWIGATEKLIRWKPPGSFVAYSSPVFNAITGLNGMNAIAIMQDGSMWVGMTLPGRGGGLQRFRQGAWTAFVTPTFDSSALTIHSLTVDSRNSLWVGAMETGLYRIHEGKVERFRRADGLSSDSVECFFEDREGNLWVATSEGVDRFRDLRVLNFSTREGLSGDQAASVLASRDGTLWIGNGTGLDFVRGGTVSSIGPKNGLPGQRVNSLFEDHAGRLWIGIEDGLFVYEGGKFTPVRLRDGGPTGSVIAITEDVDRNIWAKTVGIRRLLRIQDREVRDVYPEPQMPHAFALAADPQGGVWLGLMNNALGRYRMGKLETFPLKQRSSSRVVDLTVNSDGAVLGATGEGLIEWRDGNLRTLSVLNGLPCSRIHSFIFDRQSDLWLYAECGLLRIARDQLQKWREHPDAKIAFKLFDVFDGAQPGLPPFRPAATRSPDGRLWFANEKAVQVIDPEHLADNPLPPPVIVEKVIADQKSYSPGSDLHLPPRTRDLEIHYTALSFVVPQKVRFRYKLEGHDLDWQDPGTRRQAYYNDLRPGDYAFRVIASNNDGVWNETGAKFVFRVLPAWYQTYWFLGLCAGASLFLLWGAYSLRVRQIARSLSVRFDERLAERTRIARELHDTLLQTVQGSKMVADVALERADDSAHVRRALEKLSKWLGQATQEGREALNSLRASAIETNDLAAGLQRATEECLLNRSMAVQFSVTGEARDMHPVVRDEIYRIGYEAIRNSCEHSSARQLFVELNYGRDLTLRVIDNGVGLEPAVLEHGKDGHFGMRGMRERAERIASKLTLVSAPNSGAVMTLVVPGGMIFQKANPARFERIRAVFRRTDRAPHQD